MFPHKLRHTITQFVAATVALMVLAAGCFGAVICMFGQTNLHRIATLEASKLADVELNQLVGTTNYAKDESATDNTVLHAVSSTLHLPFTDPLTMLTAQLPETQTEVTQNTSGQSSLIQSISSWAATTNKIAMGWLTSTSSSACIQMLKDNPGINVASPTWFTLNDASGNISGNVLPDVVTYAHQHNIKVWVLVSNDFSSSLTHAVLQNPKARANLIDELSYQAKVYHLDGINVDFENVAAADRDAFTAFMKQLHDTLSPAGVNLSVDVAPDIVPFNDSAAFFHAGLSDSVDEMVLMAYDEHWSSDQDPGPVADMPWVTQSVNDLLDTGVPTDKLVLGMPFYTELWHVHKNGHVTSKAVGISNDSITGALAQYHAQAGQWNDQLDLMYTRQQQTDGYMEMWYPSQKTYSDDLNLVNQNGLAGVAVWSLDWSDKKTWSSVVNALRNTVS
ncbi:glycosyl hydrolase family 18 protein [Alicyclobacillus fastidiosus]|uniref:Glycosyl hydrolase family 18 protein n=1 Tax=Alicyclobacillus fastidiosus TaxID=392011 RepID=A0ABV5AHN0_9BACL|nr:glycosyl hydrolase family 18 protein [Alicyclobacillus fastidiosus]WEH11744.1 glycosyl hydrolase family 18 protein [Alicyclobacillus fastidiosus]